MKRKSGTDLNKITDGMKCNGSFKTVASPHFLQFVSVLHPTRHEYRLLAFNRWVSFTFPARMQHSVGATAQLMQHFRHIYCAQGSLLKANSFVSVFKGS